MRRERLVMEDPQQTKLIHELYPTQTGAPADSRSTELDASNGGVPTKW